MRTTLFVILFLICGFSAGATDKYVEKIPKKKVTDPKVNYGQLFIEETTREDSFLFSVTLFGGQGLANLYTASVFAGAGLRYHIHNRLQIGLEYSLFDTKFNATLKALKDRMDSYGWELEYPLLDSAGYVTLDYSLLRGHVNLASLLRIDMDFPIHFGVGMMYIEDKKYVTSLKWGIGLKILLGRRIAIELPLFLQSAGMGSIRRLYNWYSIKFVCNL